MNTSLVVALACALLPNPALQDREEDTSPENQRGLLVNAEGALQGYTLLSPLRSKMVHLVDMEGRVVHRWPVEFSSGSEYLLGDGSLLRCARIPDAEVFSGGGQCGKLQRLAWDGSVLWEWDFASEDYLQHHDIATTPDGSILMIAWEFRSHEEAVAAGRDPEALGKDGAMWPDMILEIEPFGTDGAEVLWEWHTWDHLIQDFDAEGEFYGNPAEHPERIDINGREEREFSAEELAQMRALGYLVDGGDDAADAEPEARRPNPDWQHCNAIHYDPVRDLIALSVPRFNEVWIIDHSTTIGEASSSEGGNFDKGGDLLWRWGNPASYRHGKTSQRSLFFQHDVRFIPAGYPGAGNLSLFNNGARREGGDYSAVLELELPLENGAFVREEGFPFGPDLPHWEYSTGSDQTFFSSFISGAHRLSNGNTLICSGARGRVFEVNPQGEIVWDYRHELGQEGEANDSSVPAYALFRATRIPADHPGLKGRRLEPVERP